MSSEEQNDSPAFRLRPRRPEPKSYYTVRLEYSANPAAFTRERPRNTTKRARSGSSTPGSSASSYSRTKQQRGKNARFVDYANGDQQYPLLGLAQQTPAKPSPPTKDELEREERRKRLQRDIANSITTDTMISPFMQRLELDQLEPNSKYEHNYITLRIKSVEVSSTNTEQQVSEKCLICRCSSISGSSGASDSDASSTTVSEQQQHQQDQDDAPTEHYGLIVLFYDEYARDSLLTANKIINVAKFRTGHLRVATGGGGGGDANDRDGSGEADLAKSAGDSGRGCGDNGARVRNIGFDVIVKYDSSVKTGAGQQPLLPFVSVADMIEQPLEPFVEMSPPSPVGQAAPTSSSLSMSGSNSRYRDQPAAFRGETEGGGGYGGSHEPKKVKFTANASSSCNSSAGSGDSGGGGALAVGSTA